MNILVAEDTAVNAILVKNNHEREEHRVTVVRDGAAAFAELESHPEVDLVVADIRMPEMDGIELVRKMRSHAELKDIPVLFITGVADGATVREALELNIAGYILKPVTEPSRVVAKVRAIQQEVGVVLQTEEELRNRMGIDTSVYREMLAALAEIVWSARDNGSPDDDALNTLRDSAQSVGAERLGRVLGEIPGAPVDPQALTRELKALGAELEIRGLTPEPAPTE